ncbi:hypothetical protein CLAIMM_12651 [Cladophialophora immunda]|nr:hypothetical protein CLAIMM_12651 [Cladophialophora immunda]
MSTRPSDAPRASKSGIQTTADGASYIPASKRADGSTRKEIRVRPGYRPPEDVETYKNRSAEAWKNRGQGGVPGAESLGAGKDEAPTMSKNAKRREAARKRATAEGSAEGAGDELASAMQKTDISARDKRKENWHDPSKLATNELRAVRDLREKRAAGEKLSHDQIMKIGKEGELLRDLKKLGYDGPELEADASEPGNVLVSSTNLVG